MEPVLTRLGKFLGPIALWIAAAGLWCVSGHFWMGLDLTPDKRHTVHAYTRSLLQKAKSKEVVLTVYLEGDLPVELKRLQSFTKKWLQTLKRHAPGRVAYEFVNVAKLPAQTQKKLIQTWIACGLQPTVLHHAERAQPDKDSVVFPFIKLTYLNQERHILMLESEHTVSLPRMVEQSMGQLEYKVAAALHAAMHPDAKRIALLRGHGEPDIRSLQGLTLALQKIYVLDVIDFCHKTNLQAYDALLITGPQKPFSEAEKYKLDQYIMQGGKTLFFLDGVRVDLQTLRTGRALARVVENNLSDILFKYGVRINADLVQDACAGVYPVVTGRVGNQPQISLLRWPFFPVLRRFAKHPITKGLDAIAPKFISSIDAINVEGIEQTPLVFSSEQARVLSWPVCVDLKALHPSHLNTSFDKAQLPLAYLVEGKFTSAYRHRLLSSDNDQDPLIPISEPTKLFCMGTSAIVCNDWNGRTNRAMAWGYDPFLEEQFSNPAWVLNILAYMTQEVGLTALRARASQNKQLHPLRAEKERLFWQLWNFSIPVLSLVLLRVSWYVRRKKRFARSSQLKS